MANQPVPELIDLARLPNNSQRAAETYLKRRLFRLENRAVVAQQRIFRAFYADLSASAYIIAAQVGLDTLGHNTASEQFRATFQEYAHNRAQASLRSLLDILIEDSAAAFVGGYYGRLWALDSATREDVIIKTPILRGDALREDVYAEMIRDLLGKEWQASYALEMESLELSIRRAIASGITEGSSLRPIMKRIAREMGVDIDRRRGARGSAERAGYRANFNRIQTLTRTLINRISNAGAIDAYRANSDLLSGYEWLTAHDERTCPDCAAMDGKVFSFRSRRQPPLHPNCRCTVIPVLKENVLERNDRLPRNSFRRWIEGFGMTSEVERFLAA